MDSLDFKKFNKALNDKVFTDYYYRLCLIARSIFKWEGLPEGISEKWIENYLFNDGFCMFFKHPTLGIMVSRCTLDGLNNYDEPVCLKPVLHTMHTAESYYNNTEAILICNNDLRIPTKPTIELYAFRLAEISRTIDINIHAQRTPVLIKCSDKQRLTLQNVYRQWSGNEPVIIADKSLDSEMTVLKTDAPLVFDKLETQKHTLWNECMTFLGINNANQDKRERLVADEVSANNEQIEMSVANMLRAREEACELINAMFNTNISVSLRACSEPNADGDVKGGADL